MTTNAKSNDHIASYIEAYLADDRGPPFAVLIKGGWGIGKTYFVRELLKRSPHLTDQHSWTYLSLNGLATPDDIDRALAAAIAPFLDTTLAKVVGRVATVAARYFNIDPGVKLSEVVSKLDSKLYVFDDLERFGGEKSVALGYINEFVERHGKKVIVISNVQEIGDHEFNRLKEKTIGQELQFQSHPASSAMTFVNTHLKLPEGLEAEAIVERIVALFLAGEVNNLRVLRHAVWDYSRLIKSLDAKHTNHAAFIMALTTAFFPLAFDHRLKRLTDSDIDESDNHSYAGIVETDPPSPWLAFDQRYADFEVNPDILPAAIWHDALVEGAVDQEELCAAVERTEFFKLGNRPSWRRLWSHEKETPEDLERLHTDMRARIDAREYENPDEVLHVFAVAMWLAAFGLGGRTPQQALEEGADYIDRLRSDGRLTPYSSTLRIGQQIYSRGIGYKEGDTPSFRALKQHMIDQREAVAIESMPALASELLDCISTDLEKFVDAIHFNDFDDARYLRTPLLHHIDPRQFVDAVMALAPVEQQRALASVSLRYKNGELLHELEPEEEWLRRVLAVLQADAAKANGFHALRLREYATWYFERTIAAHDAAKGQHEPDAGTEAEN